MKFWYKPSKEEEALIFGVHIMGWTGFCGGAIAHGFSTRTTWRDPGAYAWGEDRIPPKGSREKPWTKEQFLAWLARQTRGVIILADKKGGVADKYIFPMFPKNGEEFTAGTLLCTAVVSDYYINRNTRNKVRHAIITTRTKPRKPRKEKEAKA